ncbi:Histone-lysine N-methyltransferase, H3 lysine-9 specific SUVH1-like protein [Drosera capensis]
MEASAGPGVVPLADRYDKSRVLTVKPLRTLVPMFPNPPEAPPFVCSSPFGPFPSGFSPFYPFSTAQGARAPLDGEDLNYGDPSEDGDFQTPAAAVPLRSFGPQMGAAGYFSGASNGDMGGSSLGVGDDGYTRSGKRLTRQQRGSGSFQKKPRKVRDPASVEAEKMALQNSALGLSPAQREDEPASGVIKRPDLKAGNIVLTAGIRTNARKRIGAVPGVEIGDIFFFRMELCAVGLHSPSMAGIDFMTVKGEMGEDTIAVSIVSSGGYEDDAEDTDVLIYTGQGGNLGVGANLRRDKEVTDQKLVRGNLALDRSSRKRNEIRVVRGIRDPFNPLTKVYVYDGLYKIQEAWVEKTKVGAHSFKYKFVRLPGQLSAFALWQSVQRWKTGNASRAGLILTDLASGAESIPVSLVNEVDDEKGPSYFTYFATAKYSSSFNVTQPSLGCRCHKECTAGDLNCSCIRQNGGDFPYTANGVLVSRKQLVYECGSSCSCFPNCKTRVSQSGKVIDKAKFAADEAENNDYVFETWAFDHSLKWNYDPALIYDEDEEHGESNEEYDRPFPLVINAKDGGNIARFMNHSCSPNVFWQPIVYENSSGSQVHIAFFALRHIPPITELTFDYGVSQPGRRRKQCLCGSPKCKGNGRSWLSSRFQIRESPKEKLSHIWSLTGQQTPGYADGVLALLP